MLEKVKEREEIRAYSVEDVANQTSLSKPFLRNEIRAGRLRVKRFGRRVLILREDLESYLKGENG